MIWPEQQLSHKIKDFMEKDEVLKNKEREGNTVGDIVSQFQQNPQYFGDASTML